MLHEGSQAQQSCLLYDSVMCSVGIGKCIETERLIGGSQGLWVAEKGYDCLMGMRSYFEVKRHFELYRTGCTRV
jgi:hypothetical protein